MHSQSRLDYADLNTTEEQSKGHNPLGAVIYWTEAQNWDCVRTKTAYALSSPPPPLTSTDVTAAVWILKM